jgi:hypothetical protein
MTIKKSCSSPRACVLECASPLALWIEPHAFSLRLTTKRFDAQWKWERTRLACRVRRDAEHIFPSSRPSRLIIVLTLNPPMSNFQSTPPQPKSTVDLGCEKLIRVENTPQTPFSPAPQPPFSPITTRPWNRSGQIQTFSNIKAYPPSPLIGVENFPAALEFGFSLDAWSLALGASLYAIFYPLNRFHCRAQQFIVTKWPMGHLRLDPASGLGSSDRK